MQAFILCRCQIVIHLFFQGTTTYFSENCNEQDAEIAQEFMVSKVIYLFCPTRKAVK